MKARDSGACDPPLADSYNEISSNTTHPIKLRQYQQNCELISECELPVVDLRGLRSCDRRERQACVEAIAEASTEWGFFQVLNHGISSELLSEIRREQIKLFKLPFEKKASSRLLNDSYRWGTPTAISPRHFNWSEAFHVPLSKISEEGRNCYGEFNSLRGVMEKVAGAMSELAGTLAGVLAENMGCSRKGFPESCNKSTCFLRLNHYPPCPLPGEVFGLMPHTDSDFLTILCQDQVGGLQLMKDTKWVAVKPNPDALIVNIGDLFQAWSNDVYRSVEHKVTTNAKMDRYSIAYFMCPSYESAIGSCRKPSAYREFTFGEYRKQVQEDVKIVGQKVGLPRFRL
ncbi:gibberellin 2-beta-dioxygenase 8 [Canna indica]|uniref:gibberellin 2beta-dioxygenase n=1 Tax=Canna indica TaxID=4628 RepID=A0AAQ3KEP5_9LILI|nr:gibberellin 2-beta-dioxygenase 8 [Canna indica]